MKKTTKITLIVLGAVLALGIIIFIGADVWVSRIAMNKVNQALTMLPEGKASCGLIQVRLFSGTVGIDDIRFDYRGEPVHKKDTTSRPGVSIYVEHIELGRIFYSMMLKKEVLVSDLYVVRPRVELWLDDKHPENCFPKIEMDTTLTFPLNRAELMHFHLKNASMALHSLRTKLDVTADSCSLTAHHLAYDSVFTYCDSVYRFSLDHAAILFPDGRMKLETRDINHEDQGSVIIGSTRIANTMPKNKLGDIVREPVTWMDMQFEHVELSPLNPIRKALAQDLSLDQIDAVVKQMNIYRDNRYAPTKPFPMPQQILTSLPVTFLVKQANANIKAIHIELASTKTNIGKMDLKNIKAKVDNITNRRNAILSAGGTCPLNQGSAQASFEMRMDKQCGFSMHINAKQINTNMLNSFVRPLVGMTSDCIIDELSTEYSGDKTQASGTFRMLYHGLKIQVHKEDDIPYKIITRNANTFNTLGNSLIPKSNPSSVDVHPRAYQVVWKRDEWKPFPLYLFGPCIDGVKKTFLPGLYVHLQTKQ